MQTRSNRSLAHTKGKLSCPLGRCEVSPLIPNIDDALKGMLETKFASRLAARSVRESEAEEERKAVEVNAWVEAGCPLETLPEDCVVEDLEGTTTATPALPVRRRSILRSPMALLCLLATALVLLSIFMFMFGMDPSKYHIKPH